MSAPVKNASPVSSKHAARGSLAPGSVFALAFALFGVGVAEMYCDGFAYEVLIHRVFPIPGRSFPIPAAVAAHLLLWVAAVRFGSLSLASLLRATRPLLLLNGFLIPLAMNTTLGFPALFTMLALVGYSAWRVLQECQPGPLQVSARFGWGVAIIACLAYIAWSVWYQQLMYRQLLMGYSDIGYYYLRLKNTLVHGDFLQIESYRPPFWDHFCPGLAILLPLFMLWPTLDFLMVVQPVVLAGTGLLLLWIARREAPQARSTFAVPILFLLYPAVTHLPFNYSYGFHPVTLALPLLILSTYWIDRGKHRWAILPAIVTMLIQEHMAVYYAGIGMTLVLRKDWKPGLIWGGAGTAYFLLIMMWFMPWHTGGQNVHVGLWGNLGGSIPEIALNLVLQPELILGAVFNRQSMHLLALLLLPLAGGCLAAPRFLLMLSPIFLFNCLRPDDQSLSIAFHYQTGTIGLLFLALILGVYRQPKPGVRALPFLGAGLMIALFASLHVSLMPWTSHTMGMVPETERLPEQQRAFEMLQHLIPADATVTADDRCRGALLDRRLALHYADTKQWATEYHAYQVGAWNSAPDETHQRVQDLLDSGEYTVIYQQNKLIILKAKKTPPRPPDDLY